MGCTKHIVSKALYSSFFCVVTLLGVSSLQTAQAQTFPNKQVRMVVPFPPGGSSDRIARILSERLSQQWGQPVVSENINGAGGNLAAANVARSRADGYSILFATHPIIAINPLLYGKLPYNPSEDFIPVVKLMQSPLVLLVQASSPIRSIPDLIKIAKDNPNSINFGSGGIGTTQHLTGEMLKQTAGINITHIPYKGNGQTDTALIAGDIQMFFDNVQSAKGQILGGRVRGVAISSNARLASMPDLPTVKETLPGFESTLAYGLLVPKGTPAAIVSQINQSVNKVLFDPALSLGFTGEGATIEGGSPEKFTEFLASENKKWGQILAQLKLKLD